MHTGRPVAWAVQSGSAPSPEQKLEVIGAWALGPLGFRVEI